MDGQVVFLGGVWKKEDERIIIENSIGNVQLAANVLQTLLIEGLDNNLENPITILNEVFVGAFPKRYKKPMIKNGTWNHSNTEKHVDFNIGFLNIPLYKHFSRYMHSKKYIRKICKTENSHQKIYFIGYSMSFSIVMGLKYAKKCNQNVRTCLIIPDLPEYMNLGKQRKNIFSVLKKIAKKQLYREIKHIDSFVTLTKYIYEALDVKKPYTVVEGIASSEQKTGQKHLNTTTKDFVYTGTLGVKYGIIELVDAFTRINDPSLRLVICGAGDGLEHILEASKDDDRIQYKGIVSNSEAKEIQKNAYVLVNPRSNKEEYTKFSFPSKTMEYMATGRPVLMYKLKGIPDEYDDYIYYIENDIETALKEMASISSEELNIKGNRARLFVQNEKNKEKQTKKIIDLLKSLK